MQFDYFLIFIITDISILIVINFISCEDLTSDDNYGKKVQDITPKNEVRAITEARENVFVPMFKYFCDTRNTSYNYTFETDPVCQTDEWEKYYICLQVLEALDLIVDRARFFNMCRDDWKCERQSVTLPNYSDDNETYYSYLLRCPVKENEYAISYAGLNHRKKLRLFGYEVDQEKYILHRYLDDVRFYSQKDD